MKKREYKKIVNLMNKVKSSIYNELRKKAKYIIYAFVFMIGIAVIVISFYTKDNWINICAGVGTGILTSLIVSVVINAENNARDKRKKEEEKRYLLNNVIEISIDVYEDIIHRINEFITLTDLKIKSVYKLYDDFTVYNDFEKCIKEIEIDNCSEEMLVRLNKLFNFDNYRIDYLIAELKQIPKQEYFLRGLLTQEECDKLISNYQNDSYLKYEANIDKFWKNEIINKEDCIKFLRMTIFICTKTIACFSYSKKKAEGKEKFIKEIMNQLYFDEVHSKSDAFIEDQKARAEAEEQYYAEHPEEWEALQQQYEDIMQENGFNA